MVVSMSTISIWKTEEYCRKNSDLQQENIYIGDMNLRLIISAILLFCAGIQSYAQKIDTTFYDADWKDTDRANHSFYRIMSNADDGKFSVTDYFKTGEVQMTGTFKSLSPQVKDGEFVWYHKNGKKQTVTIFQDNATISTKSWDEEGVEVINVPPEFPGGMQELYKYIGSNFRYPKGLTPKPVGKINLSFVIDTDGSITDIVIVESLHQLLDAEAVKVLLRAPRWKPGTQNGRPVRVKYNIPLSMR